MPHLVAVWGIIKHFDRVFVSRNVRAYKLSAQCQTSNRPTAPVETDQIGVQVVLRVGFLHSTEFELVDKERAVESVVIRILRRTPVAVSLLGAIGGGLLNSICKSNSCLSLARLTGSFKIYALYTLGELIIMGIIAFVLAKSRHKAELEAKKSASIQIAKPKQG